jgi:Na+/melibiose symporter-like transporter
VFSLFNYWEGLFILRQEFVCYYFPAVSVTGAVTSISGNSSERKRMNEDMISIIFSFVFGLLALYLVIWLYVLLPAGMANNRGRSAFGWVVLSLLVSPILACLLLWLLGDNPNRFDNETET